MGRALASDALRPCCPRSTRSNNALLLLVKPKCEVTFAARSERKMVVSSTRIGAICCTNFQTLGAANVGIMGVTTDGALHLSQMKQMNHSRLEEAVPKCVIF